MVGAGVGAGGNGAGCADAKREWKDREEVQTRADASGNKTVVVRLRGGEEGNAFGSITNSDSAEALRGQHQVEVDRHRIDLKEPIRTLGEHQVTLRLHKDVDSAINLIVTQDR